MTGDEIRQLRRTLGLTGAQLSLLLGVNPSTLYRWESRGATRPSPDPMQWKLLALIQSEIAKAPVIQVLSLKDVIATGLATGGTLRGLHALLAFAFEEK